MKYIAFLRAVNVGGHNKIKMDVLKKLFVSLGYKNVETVIQSGNVIFETLEKNVSAITTKIEKKVNEFMKKDIAVFVRTFSELSKIVISNPFGKTKADDKIKTYVFFLYKEPEGKLKLPLVSPNKEINVFEKINLSLFMLVKKIPGKASSPNDFIEKTFGVSVTARNWNVVCNIVEKASAQNHET
jgi:uncharacterized protein (DUF1697 family)